MANKIGVFISYAHEDEALRKELEIHLVSLEQQGLIKIWHNCKITPRAGLKQEITRHLNTAQIILLLISPAFIASEDTYTEMKGDIYAPSIECAEQAGIRCIPLS